ncbi:ABC1-domain-containing protein [Laetiporus sulphureus 93-53]|uniref:ABC1-domain-containing protein n=1 Tax=Laetiporus sulphureus 93-53 TaxID=1314785 RepID=A0A165DFN9_9APHY|nr:ABC1-domain-containing protein [Laetiporus sulphureus 93-53]KZT04793.1 ABC1-domain-containing protein [Laetiporus sulphureus 93-53]
MYTAGGVAAFWALDREYNASAIARNIRTFWTCAMIAIDYKMYFKPELSDSIPALHQLVAERMYDLFTSNGGLYIKIGQAFANNAALMPRPMQEKFSKLFDDAPQVPYSVVESVFKREFGRPPAGPDGIFEIFEEQAAASASIAQVHRAKLKPDDGGSWVAVKIQKPEVSKQVEWDLGAFRAVMWIYEKYLFDMPVYFTVDFISDHLRRELDFELEARNALKTTEFVASEPRLSDRVYIPRVYPHLSTKKVMVAEWIDGVRLSDRRGIRALMGEGEGETDVPLRFGTLRGGVASIMQTMVELFSAQIFEWGWVHCDPHPGNIIVRPHPQHPTLPQFVLLDHGLYVRLSRDFQQQYATLWTGLMTLDLDVVKAVAGQWGIGAPDLFASATLMRPVRFAGQEQEAQDWEEMTEYERSMLLKEKLKSFLTDTDKIPKPLIFIGRNMRIVQGNNQSFGSPVNRIRITGSWASRSLTLSPNLTLAQRLKEYKNYFKFLLATFMIDLAFWANRVRQWMRHKMGLTSEGFEDELERSMRGFAKRNLGIELGPGVFEG